MEIHGKDNVLKLFWKSFCLVLILNCVFLLCEKWEFEKKKINMWHELCLINYKINIGINL